MINSIDMSLLRLQINELLYIINYFLGRETTKTAQECLENLCLLYLFPSLYNSTDLETINTLRQIVKKLDTNQCHCNFNYTIFIDGSEVIKLLSILGQET